MPDTTRIRSGFDVEVHFGADWFQTALQGLADAGLLLQAPLPPPFPANPTIQITVVDIVPAPSEWDLSIQLTLDGIPVPLFASIDLSASGDELEIKTNVPNFETTVPFDVLDGLAGPPVIQKLAGGGIFAPAIALLANLDLRTSPQGGDPLPAGQHEPRGTAELAQSFLPLGKDIALGVGQTSWPRFANDLWHTRLRAADGTHPLPNAEDKKGDWKAVSIASQSDRIKITLVGKVPIDLWPDGTVTVEIDLQPKLVDESLIFDMSIDTDFDTGLLGDLFGFLLGGIVGFIIGLILGGPLLGASIGAVVGVIAIEVVEYVVQGEINKRIVASLDGEAIQPQLRCVDGVVNELTPPSDGDSLSIGIVDAIPKSIPVGSDFPDALYERTVVVRSDFDELAIDGSGLAVAGQAVAGEIFQPLTAQLVDTVRDVSIGDEPGTLRQLVYRAEDNSLVQLQVSDAVQRADEGELDAPIELSDPIPGASERIPAGQLATVCLQPVAIRRKESVITDFRFSSGAELRVHEAVGLQDGGVIILPGLQLIHPRNANPYFRSPPDSTEANNLENLPNF